MRTLLRQASRDREHLDREKRATILRMIRRQGGRALAARVALLLSCTSILSLSMVPMAEAHRSGCHRWHSCPSDTGSYICGDLGYTSGCQAFGGGSVRVPPVDRVRILTLQELRQLRVAYQDLQSQYQARSRALTEAQGRLMEAENLIGVQRQEIYRLRRYLGAWALAALIGSVVGFTLGALRRRREYPRN